MLELLAKGSRRFNRIKSEVKGISQKIRFW
ncbi:hypothetical protein [Agarivorans sp. QJM3NY_30]